MNYIIGADIGTSSAKAVAFDFNGQQLFRVARKYSLQSPKPGYQIQDPDKVVQSILACIKELVQTVGYAPAAISFSSAMHSLIGLDGNNRLLTPLITWADTRAQQVAQTLKESPLGQDIYQATGTPIHAMSPLCKIAWFDREQPEFKTKIVRFTDIKSYLIFCLTGEHLMEYSLASATGLFDLKNLDWYAPALQFANIEADALPKLVPTYHKLPLQNPQKAKNLGIPKSTPLILGASDGCLANLGAMVLHKGETVITIGTSGAIRTTSTQISPDPQGRIFNYWLTEKLLVSGGATNNGGVVLDWFQKQFSRFENINQLLEGINQIPPGAEGLLFVPYMMGERAPVWDENARAGFLGIQKQHTNLHFARAILEGILYNIYHISKIMEELGLPTQVIYANGGFTGSDNWVQMLADIFGKEVLIRGHQEGSAFGAALLGMKALGVIEHFEDISAAIPIRKTYTPDSTKYQAYQKHFQAYQKMFAHLLNWRQIH